MGETVQGYIAQGIGVVGMILVFVSFQMNDKRKILLFQAGAGLVFTVHFVLLGAYTGAGMNATAVARNLLFTRGERLRHKNWWVAVFVGLFVLFGVLTWQNGYSALPVCAMSLGTVGLSLRQPRQIRLCLLPVAAAWLVYNVAVFSIAGVLTEVFNIASLVIGIWRFDRRGVRQG